MPLTKQDLVEMIYSELNLSKKESVSVLESIFKIIKDELASGNDVMISGFGKWSVKEKRARRGRNPKTGEEMMIEARKVVTFRSSKTVKVKVAEGI